MARATVELLGPGDEERLDAFLAAHSDSSMFLRSNWRAAGLADRGGRFEGTYAAAVADDNAVVGVAAHYGSGMLALQAPAGHAGPLAVAAVRATGRSVRGLVGPSAQVAVAREALGWADRASAVASREDLFALELDTLVVPDALRERRVGCERARPDDLVLATAWKVAYSIEVLGGQLAPDLERDARATVEREIDRRHLWLLRDPAGEPLAMSALNAHLPDRVQIGGVYTPPALRSRGHAGAVVAGQLLDLRAEGVRRAVLFTPTDNHAARRAYQRVGFSRVGDYALVLFAP
jgi:ribosomal protein S18 acetylase RimI-like enzyme